MIANASNSYQPIMARSSCTLTPKELRAILKATVPSIESAAYDTKDPLKVAESYEAFYCAVVSKTSRLAASALRRAAASIYESDSVALTHLPVHCPSRLPL